MKALSAKRSALWMVLARWLALVALAVAASCSPASPSHRTAPIAARLGLGLGVGSNVGRAAPFTPTQLRPKFWASFGLASAQSADLTVASGDLTIVRDHGGSALQLVPDTPGTTMTAYGTSVPQNGRAYAELRGARNSQMLGTGIGISGNVPWSISVAVRFNQLPSAGAAGLDAIAILGPKRSAGSGTCFVGSSGTAGTTVGANPTSEMVSSIWGTEVLASGTLGTALPSFQVLSLTYDPAVGVRLYIDGVLVDSNEAAPVATMASRGLPFNGTIESGTFGLSPWWFTNTPPSVDVFHAWWFDYQLSHSQVRALTAWTIADLALPATAPALILIGDSYTEGTSASVVTTRYMSYASGSPQTSDSSTDYGNQLGRLLSASPHNQPITIVGRGHSGYASTTLLTGPSNGSSTYYSREIDTAIGVRRTKNMVSVLLGTNDAYIGYSQAQWQAGLQSLSPLLRASGFAPIFFGTIPPDLEATPATPFAARSAMSAWMRVNYLTIGDTIFDLEDVTDPYVVPGAVPAWVTATAYTAGDRVSRIGRVYQCTTAGTSSTGPSGTGTGITDGSAVWAYLAAGDTVGSFLVDLTGAYDHPPGNLHYNDRGYKTVAYKLSRAMQLKLGLP